MDENENDLPVDDTALFSSTVTGDQPTTEVPTEVVPTPAATTTTEPTTTAAATEQRPEPAIPPARLREEAEGRRAAERERDDLKARLERFEAQQRQQPQAERAKPAEFWENPDEWGKSLVTPIQQQLFQQRQNMSRLLAEDKHGSDTVKAAYDALGQAMQDDPAVQTDYMRIMRANHPYGELVAWHKSRQVLTEIGSDPAAYRTRVIEEAMKDPEVQKRFLEQLRGAAQPTVEAPSRSAVPAIPSLQSIGTAASPAAAAGDPNDAELFSATTRRARARG